MKERPIIFNSEMVRSILDGRKTQTRRTIKQQPYELADIDYDNSTDLFYDRGSNMNYKCPFGKVGDVLWVRETFGVHPDYDDISEHGLIYKADYNQSILNDFKNEMGMKWTPSIHMPKWACRLRLKITDIRVERLQSISEVDAIKEGLHGPFTGTDFNGINQIGKKPSQCFAELWNSIYKNWDENPWVWVVEFETIKER
ncbi:MAG: hypothetical protein Unbinned5081contig1003_35 [Prokaryotic dsDNA virus sp.]|nr:MAG: hypothetical protein Unbinned5081contig1003_35 [Prokaryotic dsDNA virus sp.]|tara:strand:- start:33015 stop:33611 length:597 start_codon:yes stop_codon:yes gene_type:complete